jgi:hypothetical protein
MPRRKSDKGGPAADVIRMPASDIKAYRNDARRFLDKDRVKALFEAEKTHAEGGYRGKKARFWVKDKETGANFTCKLRSLKCCGKSAKGTPCRRNVAKGLFLCYQHTRSLLGLRVDQSKLNPRMQGLFVCSNNHGADDIVFRRGDEICPYFGEIINKKTLSERYPGDTTAPYALQISANKFIDSACLQSIGAKANTASSGFRNNARFSSHHNLPYARIVATGNIRNGDEILVSYGPKYRLDGPTKSGVRPKAKIAKKKKNC